MKKLSKDIRLVIFDVDGTLRRMKSGEKRAPLQNDEWEYVPGIVNAIAPIYDKVEFGIATNQACIGRGEISNEEAYMMMWGMIVRLIPKMSSKGTAIQICRHLPDSCVCRKPSPAMLYSIMRDCGIMQKNTLFVGDAKTDEQAAENCGCHFMYINEFLDLGKE